MTRQTMLVLMGILIGPGVTAVRGGVPTREERIRDSGLNPSHCTWAAQRVFVRPPAATGQSNTWPVVGFRHDITLSAPARRASLTLYAKGTDSRFPFVVAVNGKAISSVFPYADGYVKTVDLAPHLHPGVNALALSTVGCNREAGWFALAAEGAVFCDDGSTVPLRTDARTWRGGWGSLPAGWDTAGVAFTNVPPLEGWGLQKWEGDGPRCNPPYYGAIQVALPSGMTEPVFDEEKPVELALTILNARGGGSGGTNEGAGASLSFEVMDENSRQTVRQGAVELKPLGKLDLAGASRIGPLPKGAYRIRFAFDPGNREAVRRDYEIAVVGEIKQRLVEGADYEEGMDLRDVWSVDCTQDTKPGEFLALYEISKGETPLETRVVDGPAGRYREMVRPEIYSHFAYRFKVKNLFRPHLAVVEWPDDAPRQIVAQVVEGESMIPEGFGAYQAGYGFTRGEASVMCTDDYPRSNKMRKLRFIYWPNEEDEAFHIFNYHGQAPAAAARLAVYEILNDIPALRIMDGGDRLIGYHTERGPYTMSMTYYSGPLGVAFPLFLSWGDQEEFYRNWYGTTENLVKRMRFAGQNLYVMGHFMYFDRPTHLAYPSNRYGVTRPERDYIALIARMFERNGLSLSSCVEFLNTRELIRDSPATIEEVRAGAPTLFAVTKDGEFQNMVGDPVVNFFHPRVQEHIQTIVNELADLYSSYPAWKGIALVINSTFCGPLARFVKDPFDMGYEDYTVALFEKETGSKVPGDAADPQRFYKRYEWVTANAQRRQQWTDWRCAQFTRQFRSYRDRLVKARPDLKLFLCMREPQAARINQYFKDKLDGTEPMKESLKLFGYDAEALRKEPGIVTSFMFMSPGTKQGHEARDTPMWKDLGVSQDWHNLFANDGKGGAYIFSGFTEGNRYIAKGKWMWQFSVVRQGYPWPPDEYANDRFVNALVRANPTIMPHTWADVNDPGGHLQEQRLFARAFRSLPNGQYVRLTGHGLNTNLWVETCRRGGAEYGYAANPQWWPLEEVTLSFADGAKVHDLIADKPIDLHTGTWSFRLGPYEVRTFRIDGLPEGGAGSPASAVRSGSARPASAASQRVETALEAARKLLARARARQGDLLTMPGWRSVAPLEGMVREIDGFRAAGEMSRAWDAADSSAFRLAQRDLVGQALECMPLIVLGSFGDRKDTVQLPNGSHEVSPEYRGMEIPYLGETTASNGLGLTAGFMPDVKRPWAAYPDAQTRWRPTLKTDFLSFYGICHSEAPYWMAAYAFTEIHSPEDREAVLLAGSDHALRIWVNDRCVLTYGGQGTPRGGQRPSRPDQNRAEFMLKKGWNRLLVKAVQRGETRIFLRLTDKAGNPMDDLRFRVPTAG